MEKKSYHWYSGVDDFFGKLMKISSTNCAKCLTFQKNHLGSVTTSLVRVLTIKAGLQKGSQVSGISCTRNWACREKFPTTEASNVFGDTTQHISEILRYQAIYELETWPASTKGAICFGGCHPQAPITITCCFEIFWSSGHMLHANAMKNKLQQCPCLAASLSHSTIETLPFHDVHRGSNAHTFTSVLLCFQCRSNFRINPLNIKVRAVWYTLPAQRDTFFVMIG